MWKKFLAVTALVGLLSTSAVQASSITDEPLDTGVPPVTEVVSSLTVSPSAFNPAAGESTVVDLNLSAAAEDVYAYVVNSSNRIVATLANHVPSVSGAEYSWYGTTGNVSGAAALANGAYTVKVFVSTDEGVIVDVETADVQLVSTTSGIIKDFTLDPSGSWDPTDEDLEIEYELTSEVNNLAINAKKGSKMVEILDDRFVDDDDYTELWDGTDDDGDLVDEGAWEIIITADGDTLKQTVNVEYETPDVVQALVTKESIDPSEQEQTSLLFKVDTESLATVEVLDGSKRELTLWNGVRVKKNLWYAVDWSGLDKDGEKVSESGSWKFKITVENPVDDDIFSVETVAVDIAKDEVSSSKTNIMKDVVFPSIFDRDTDSTITVEYCLDDNAEVYLAAYDGTSISGKPEVTLLDYVSQPSGCHSASWDGTDDKGKKLKDDIYSYKIIAKSESGRKETEIGRFVVGDRGGQQVFPPDDGSGTTVPPVSGGDCGGYSDTKNLGSSSDEMCWAIKFVTDKGIFNGYDDGSFGPYNNITRAEVLKVVLRAFASKGYVSLLPVDGSNAGFPDVNSDAWYMPYVRTAKLYGMIHGYTDGEAKLDRSVSRVELLKFALEASESFTNYTIQHYTTSNYADVAVGEWFADYAGVSFAYILFNEFYDSSAGRYSLHPHAAVQRGEAALMLYRMENGGLLDGSANGGGYGPYNEAVPAY